MSIEMENPKTPLELVDAAANLVEQMYFSHMIHDEKTFREAHKKASEFLHQATIQLDESVD
jgi:hypothetical protein